MTLQRIRRRQRRGPNDSARHPYPIRASRPLRFLLPVLIGVVLGMAAGSANADGCNGFSNYVDELLPSNFQVASETPLGDGISLLALTFDVTNVDFGDFASASAFLDASERLEELGVEAATQSAALGPIAPFAQATTTVDLELRVPSANVGTLLAELEAGLIPLTVHAEEQDVLADGVQIVSWSSAEDGFYALARDTIVPSVNPDPSPPPYAPGQQFGIVLLAPMDRAGSVFDYFDENTTLYVVPDEYTPSEIPEAMHYARVVDVAKTDESGSGGDASDLSTVWWVTLARTDTESLPDLYASGSFCTGSSSHIDLPVQASRIDNLDGIQQEEESRDGHPQAINWNETPMETGVTLSGQIAGHILKPSLELRLRDGAVYAAVNIDTDLSLSAELRAEASKELGAEFFLYDLCFPLPDLIAGPVPIELNLQVQHWVGAEGDIRAGAVVGFQKRFQAGHSIGFDGRRSEGEKFFSEPHHDPTHPVEFTPPQLVDETGVTVSIYTELRTTLRIGAAYPFCDTGAGVYVGARARGTLDVDPVDNPWWSLGHDASTFAGILDLEVFGFEIADYEVEAELFPGADTLDAGGPLMLVQGGGSGASVEALSSPASSASSMDPAILSGLDHRWAFAIDRVGVPNGTDRTTIADRGTAGLLVATGEHIPGRNDLIALDQYGVLDWALRYASVREPRSLIPLPDGTTLVVGKPSWYARHDAQGNVLAAADVTVTDEPTNALHCVVGRAAAIEETPGAFGYVAVGHHARGDVRQRDACAFRVDAAGQLVWARTYGEGGAQELYDVMVAADGRIVAVGEAETGPNAYSLDNPLFMSLDASDGTVEWAKTLPMMSRNAHFNTVAEAPDGTIFAAGASSRSVTKTGAALVARIDADGADAQHALILQDELWETEIAEANFVDGAGGDTPYDVIFELVEQGGGFLFAGRTGLGADTAGWVGRINENLGVEWFRHFDGDDADGLDGLTLTENGLLVSGFSRSLASYAPEDDSQLWVMKLALEGGASLLDGSGLATRYLTPGVRGSSGDDAVVPDGIVTMDAALIEVDALVDSYAAVIEDVLADPADLCITRLSVTGQDSDVDACEPIPVPEPEGMLVFGAVALWWLERRRGRA